MCMYVGMHICMCVRISMHVMVYVSIYVCVCVYVYIHRHMTYTEAFTEWQEPVELLPRHLYLCAYAYVCMYAYFGVYVRRTCMHVSMHVMLYV